MSSGWYFLAAMIVAYGVANLLQSVAACRTTVHHTFDPGLLLRLVSHRTYLVGLGCQLLGFVLAFVARRDLPLFLVQASVAAGLGVTAMLGVGLLRWRLPPAEVALLALLVLGIVALVHSARPAQARPLGTAAVLVLVAALGAISAAGVFAARLHGVPGSVALGGLAGLAFSAAAVAARPLAAVHSPERIFTDPLLVLLVAHSLVGQLLLGLAMQRGSTTAAIAAMDAAGAVPAAIVGLLLLGDRIWPGREWLATAGFLVTLAAVIGLTRYAEPQHQHTAAPVPLPRAPAAPLPRDLAVVLVNMSSISDKFPSTTARSTSK
jgi:drug/metabolite transporter (DMT)-like permease